MKPTLVAGLERPRATVARGPLGRARVATTGAARGLFGPARVALALGVLTLAAPLHAQDASRFEAGGGVRWIGAIPFDEVDARETTSGGGTRDLFKTKTSLDGSAGGEARFSVRLTSILGVEGSLAFNRTSLRTQVSADAEGAPDLTVADAITQYLIEGGAIAQVPRWRGSRVAPFVAAGAGYLRQLHDGRTLIETGRSYYVGAGIKYRLRPTGALGLRADVRALFLNDGVALDEGTRTAPSLSASLFFRF